MARGTKGPIPEEPNRGVPSEQAPTKTKRKMLAQTDMPAYPISEVERIPRAIADEYAGSPVSPLDLARAVRMQPGSGPFRMLVSASIAYGLTDGSAWAERIELTTIGRRLVRPQEEGDDIAARREALMRPRIPREFLEKYNGAKLPREDIALNVLEGFGVPTPETKRVFSQIASDARLLGLLTSIKGVEYVQLDRPYTASPLATPTAVESMSESSTAAEPSPALIGGAPKGSDAEPGTQRPPDGKPAQRPPEERRVFITHGSNKSFVALLERFLRYGELEPIVAEKRETTSIPLRDKVFGAMRSCGAAIIHVDDERRLVDLDGKEHVVLNENVLVEIGAALALYGERFILLVKDGIQLPSNLDGLYQVRYTGDDLGAEATMKLLEAIADLKRRPMPQATAAA